MAREACIGTDMKWDWHKREVSTIAQGALTNSKRPETFVKGIYPTHLKKGRGCHVWDMDGRRYVDFICGLGSSIIGYGDSEVSQAVAAAAADGPTLSLATDQEVLLGEKIQEIFPSVERLKFLKTGSDACTAAVRIARAKTGRVRVLSEGYHGWADGFVSMSSPALGVADHFYFDKIGDAGIEDAAAVIIEPVMTDPSEPRIQWVRDLREKCTKHGTLLIFDEVITGFRYPKYSVSNQHGIEPDLICLGKAMGNGFPVSAVGGREATMNCGEYFVSSTFAGETCSIAAALKTITLLQTKYPIDQLWEAGGRFLMRFNSIWHEGVRIEGYPTRGVFVGDMKNKALFWQESVKAGLLFGPSWFFNFAHLTEVDTVLATCADIMGRIRTGAVKLEGELPQSPFAQRMRESK